MSLKKVKITAIILIFSLFAQNLFSAASKTPEPYSDNEFPGFLHDLRRAEIITLGAMPFITFNATLGYSLSKFAFNNFDLQYFVNPFAQSSDSSFSTDEQIGIILTSLGISLCIGITDFIVNSVKRSNAKKKINNPNNPVKINPIKRGNKIFNKEYNLFYVNFIEHTLLQEIIIKDEKEVPQDQMWKN